MFDRMSSTLKQYGWYYTRTDASIKALIDIGDIIKNEALPESVQRLIIKKIILTSPFLNLNHGITIDECPLHLACRYQKVRLAQFLIKHGADVNKAIEFKEDFWARNVYEEHQQWPKLIPLHYLLMNCFNGGDKKIIFVLSTLLLEAGTHLTHHPFFIPLQFACAYDIRLAELFLAFGAQIDEQNIYGNTLLLQIAQVNPNDYNKKSQHFVYQHVSNLIALGCDVNFRNSKGESAIYLAACNKAPIIDFLFKSGACLTQTEMNQSLVRAIQSGDISNIQTLLVHGASASIGLRWLINSLYWKDHDNHVAIFHLLLEYGANINQLDKLKPVVTGCAEGRKLRMQLIKLMIDHGADRNIRLSYENQKDNYAMQNIFYINQIIANYKPSQPLSLKQRTIMHFFKHPGQLPADRSVLPEELDLRLRDAGCDLNEDVNFQYEPPQRTCAIL